jgi:hypothetical protein
MESVITLGRRLLPIDQITLIELFDSSSNPDFKPDKESMGSASQSVRGTYGIDAAGASVSEAANARQEKLKRSWDRILKAEYLWLYGSIMLMAASRLELYPSPS